MLIIYFNIIFKNDLKGISIDQNLLSIQNEINLIYSNEETIACNDNFNFYLKILSQLLSGDETLWRLFKGRLYTRLHDKRIQELNLNAILNVSYLFLILIKSISKPIEAVRFSIKK